MKSIQAGIVFSILLVNVSFANAAMETRKWTCENGLRTLNLTFEQGDEKLSYRVCADSKCTTLESSGIATRGSSVGTVYRYDIGGSKIGENLAVYFSENAKMGTIPKDGKVISIDKGTHSKLDPSEKFQSCRPATTK